MPRNQDEKALYAAMAKLFPGQPLRPEDDFFDDLGGHSLLAVRLVSLLRADPRYESLSIQDVYRVRRLEAIASQMRDQRRREKPDAAPERRDVPWQRRALCGVVQSAVIPLLMLTHIATWLVPFFVYHYFTGDEGDSILLAVAFSVAAFVITEAAMFPLAVAGKWLIAGRSGPAGFRSGA